jgi:hypothetical protein
MARISAGVAELVNLSKLAGFSLPDQLIKSYEACVTIQQLTLETLSVLDVEIAAEQIVATATRGEPIDLLELGRDIELGTRDRAAVNAAELAKRSALERAGDSLITTAHSLTEEIITNHLRPAFEAVLNEAKKPAEVVRKHAAVTSKDLRLSESEAARAVRAALRALEPLAEKRLAIAQARGLSNRFGARRPEHDHDNSFAELKTPQALVPGWKRPDRFAYPDIPTDPTERLIWLVTDGASGQPWLPTVAEQDQVWLDIYGEVLARQKAANTGWPRIMTQ